LLLLKTVKAGIPQCFRPPWFIHFLQDIMIFSFMTMGSNSSRWQVIEGSFDGLWKIPKMCFIENMTIARSIWLTKN